MYSVEADDVPLTPRPAFQMRVLPRRAARTVHHPLRYPLSILASYDLSEGLYDRRRSTNDVRLVAEMSLFQVYGTPF